MPKQGQRSDLANALNELKTDGFSEEWVDKYPTQAVMYNKSMETLIKKIKHIHWKPRDRYQAPEVTVLFGVTGSGKTREAAEAGAIFCDYDSRYPWGHYEGNPVVCYDEFDGQIALSTLLKQLDGYNITVQIPYEGNKPWIPRSVYICSNKNPNIWYKEATVEQREALWRRFKTVVEFTYGQNGQLTRIYLKGEDPIPDLGVPDDTHN